MSVLSLVFRTIVPTLLYVDRLRLFYIFLLTFNTCLFEFLCKSLDFSDLYDFLF